MLPIPVSYLDLKVTPNLMQKKGHRIEEKLQSQDWNYLKDSF